MTDLIQAKDAKFITLDKLNDVRELAERTVDAIIVAVNKEVYRRSLLGVFDCQINLQDFEFDEDFESLFSTAVRRLLVLKLSESGYKHSMFTKWSSTFTIYWDT